MSQASGFCSLEIATLIQGHLSTNSHAASAACHANQTRKPLPVTRATPGTTQNVWICQILCTGGHTSNVSWICFSCGIPNFSTTLFETHMADSIATSVRTENSYSILSSNADIQTEPSNITSPLNQSSALYSFNSPTSSIGPPQHTSSPHSAPHRQDNVQSIKANTFRVLTVNFQSMRAKKTAFWLLLTESSPDIIIGSETWLYPSIFEREVLPHGYNLGGIDNKIIMVVSLLPLRKI